MSYSNQQIAKLIAQNLAKNKQPIFQKGTTSSTGINKELTVKLSNGKVVRALGWNVDTPGEVNVFWDAQNKRYVAWKEDVRSLKRKVVLAKRKVRPADNKITILYNFVVAQNGGLLEGFARDENLSTDVIDLTGYEVLGLTNLGNDYIVVLQQDTEYKIVKSNEINTFNEKSIFSNFGLSYNHKGCDVFSTLLINTVATAVIETEVIPTPGSSVNRTFGIFNTPGWDTTGFGLNVFNRYNTGVGLKYYFQVSGFIDGTQINYPYEANGTNYLNGVTTGTFETSSIHSRTRLDDYYDGITVRIVSERYLSGSFTNTYKDRIFHYYDKDNNIYKNGFEEVLYNVTVNNLRWWETTGVDGINIVQKYISGSASFEGTKEIKPFTLPYTHSSHSVYKTVNTTANLTYDAGGTTTTINHSEEFRYIVPLLIGSNCSLYLTQESIYNQVGTLIGSPLGLLPDNDFYETPPGIPEGFGVNTVNDVTSTWTKNGVVSMIVKHQNTFHSVSDFSGTTYDFEQRFLIITQGQVNIGSNTYDNFTENQTLENDNKEYEIGIRSNIPSGEAWYINRKWGLHTNGANNTINPNSFFPTTPINFENVNVDVFRINEDGTTTKWIGVINSTTSEVISTNFLTDYTYKKYTSFTVQITENKGETFFKWSNNCAANTIFIIPSEDYTVSILRHLHNTNIYQYNYGLWGWENLYTVKDVNGNETVELAIAQIPLQTAKQKEHRADIYRFNTTSLKWERRANAVSSISDLSDASYFISYHPTPINKEKKKRF